MAKHANKCKRMTRREFLGLPETCFTDYNPIFAVVIVIALIALIVIFLLR